MLFSSGFLNLSSLDGYTGFTLNGLRSHDTFGGSVSDAGDVNGDGLDDFIIGASGANNDAGESYVIFGSPNVSDATLETSFLDGNKGFVIRGVSGLSVSSAGDVNGDGLDDLVMGASRAEPHGNNSGESYVVFGSKVFPGIIELSDLDGSDGFTIHGVEEGDRSGGSVSGAGDFNGDGFDDLVIGAPRAGTNGDPLGDILGESYVVFGAKDFSAIIELSELDGNNGFTIYGRDEDEFSGVSVREAGDINGDGLDDIIIGTPVASNGTVYFSGVNHIVFGSKISTATLELSELNGENGFAVFGIRNGDFSGHAASGLGDINGDGRDDLIIGVDNAYLNGSSSGGSYVVFGSDNFPAIVKPAEFDGTNGFLISGMNKDDSAGGSVSGIGDFNGDGLNDLIIGARHSDTNGHSSGESYVFFGARTFPKIIDVSELNGDNGFIIPGLAEEDYSGASVSGAGDVNGDGLGDLVIGAYHVSSHSPIAGASYIVFGRVKNDLGDAPSTYSTLLSDNGAVHIPIGPRLGNLNDGEYDSQPTLEADGDGVDDDGVSFSGLVRGKMSSIEIDVQNTNEAYLNAWIDFNADGDWDDTDEQIFTSKQVASGLQHLEFAIPDNAVLGSTYARFRLSSESELSASGLAIDGEVEDYQVTLLGDIAIDLPNSGSGNEISLTLNNDNIVIYDRIANAQLSSTRLEGTNSIVINGDDAISDTFIINYKAGGFFSLPGGIVLRGGLSDDDEIVILGTEQTDAALLPSVEANSSIIISEDSIDSYFHTEDVETIILHGMRLISQPLEVNLLNTGMSNDITVSRNSDNLLVFDNNTQSIISETPLNSIYSLMIQGVDNENDKLTIDHKTGGFIDLRGGIQFDGGLGGQDELIILGNDGVEATLKSLDSSLSNASVELSFDNASTKISFTQIEPVSLLNMAAVEISGQIKLSSHLLTIDSDTSVNLSSLTEFSNTYLRTPGGSRLEEDELFKGSGSVVGTFHNDGHVISTGSIVFSGLVEGIGDFTGNITFNGGTSFGHSPTETEINGNTTFGGGNTHTVELGGTAAGNEYDQISSTGSVNLGGSLDVQLIDSFSPQAGDSFEILSATSGINGAFNTVDLPTLSNILEWEMVTETNAITLSVSYSESAIAMFDMPLVTTPTTTNADGSVAAVPTSRSEIHEWQGCFIEVYAQVPAGVEEALSDVEFTLNYDNTQINLDLGNIEAGNGITNLAHGQLPGQLIVSGTLDGSHPNLGIGSPFLVARIPVISAVVANVSGAYPVKTNVTLPAMSDSQIGFNNFSTPLAGADAATATTTIKAVRYDINDDDRVGLADLSTLVNAFGQSTTNSALAFRSDFDKNGSVGLADLARLVNHFGYSQGDDKTISFPTIIEGEAVGFMLEGQPVVDENFASIFVGQAVPDMVAEPVFTSRQAQPDLQHKTFATTSLLEAEPIRNLEKTIENLELLGTPYELDALWSAEYEPLIDDVRLLELAAIGESSFSSRVSIQDQENQTDDLFAKWGWEM